MAGLTRDELVDGYLAHCRTQSEEHFWAFEIVTGLAMQQEWDELWAVTLLAIERTPADDREMLAIIAAGPLEDMVRYAAPVIEDRVVERIRADAKFRTALTGVWARAEREDFWGRITPLLYEYPTKPLR